MVATGSPSPMHVVQHNGGHGEAGVHYRYGFTLSAESVQGGIGQHSLVVGDDGHVAGGVLLGGALTGVRMLLSSGDVINVSHWF